MIKGKRGDAFEVVIWLVRLIFILIILLVVLFFINAFIITTIDTKEVEAFVFIQRTIYSKHALALSENNTQRVYPGVSNKEQFYSQDFDKSISYYWTDQLAANITLNDSSKLYNDLWYNRWLPMVETHLKGPGSVTEILFNTTIVYYDGISKRVVPLNYQIFVPNS